MQVSRLRGSGKMGSELGLPIMFVHLLVTTKYLSSCHVKQEAEEGMLVHISMMNQSKVIAMCGYQAYLLEK